VESDAHLGTRTPDEDDELYLHGTYIYIERERESWHFIFPPNSWNFHQRFVFAHESSKILKKHGVEEHQSVKQRECLSLSHFKNSSRSRTTNNILIMVKIDRESWSFIFFLSKALLEIESEIIDTI
jgi:hypothetical protein